MKIYSEILDKMFDTVNECEAAEAEFRCKMEEKDNREALLRASIDDAYAVLNDAQENFEVANKHAKEIIDKAEEQADAIVLPARAAVKEARKTLVDAITTYNKEYGPFTKAGDNAIDYVKNIRDWLSDWFWKD